MTLRVGDPLVKTTQNPVSVESVPMNPILQLIARSHMLFKQLREHLILVRLKMKNKVVQDIWGISEESIVR